MSTKETTTIRETEHTPTHVKETEYTVHTPAQSHARRESDPMINKQKVGEAAERAQAKIKDAARDAAGYVRRYPYTMQVLLALGLIALAAYGARGYYGADRRSVGEKITDQVKSYVPHTEEHGRSWLPWNWKLFHREPKDLSERITGQDFDTNWATLQKKRTDMEHSLKSQFDQFQDSMKGWWESHDNNWKLWHREPKDLAEKYTGKDFETHMANLQKTMHNTRADMENSLKSQFDQFQGSMKNWWDNWDTTAKQMKDELVKKTNKAGSIIKENLPEALQGGQTEHVHLYDPDSKTHTDTIKVHHHGYDKPDEPKKK